MLSKNLKKSQLFKNLNDADIISMPMFATCIKVKMERIILFMRNRESTFVFRRRVLKFGENFSWNPAGTCSTFLPFFYL